MITPLADPIDEQKQRVKTSAVQKTRIKCLVASQPQTRGLFDRERSVFAMAFGVKRKLAGHTQSQACPFLSKADEQGFVICYGLNQLVHDEEKLLGKMSVGHVWQAGHFLCQPQTGSSRREFSLLAAAPVRWPGSSSGDRRFPTRSYDPTKGSEAKVCVLRVIGWARKSGR